MKMFIEKVILNLVLQLPTLVLFSTPQKKEEGEKKERANIRRRHINA